MAPKRTQHPGQLNTSRLIVINSRAKLLIVASMPSTTETSDTE